MLPNGSPHVFCSVSLAGIFNHHQLMSPRNFHDRIHTAGWRKDEQAEWLLFGSDLGFNTNGSMLNERGSIFGTLRKGPYFPQPTCL
jgi:hypothetical protein